MIHMTLRKKTLWFLGALSFFASLAAAFAVFWLNRNDSSPAEWNFNPIWTKAEKEQILTAANFTAHRSPERFIYRGLSLNSRHIDWHMFSEVSMRQYMKDEIRERLQMIRDTAESADGRCITPSHETLLHLAAGLGEVQLLNRLLQRHADPNVQIILPQQAFPSIPDSEQGNTPLTYACQPGMDDSTPLPVHNRISCLNLLIQYGADVNKPGPLGWPPLVITCVAGIGGAPYEEAALFLLKCGADISLQPELKGKKTSLLTWATAAGYPLLVRKLCEAGYDPNFRGEMVPPLLSLNLNTPNTALQIAHILLEYGADVNAAMPASTTLPETTGDTALLNLCRQLAFIDVSQLPQIRELVSLFISEGADVNHQNAAGETPLMACCRGMLLGDDSLDRLKLGIARLLLDHRAAPSLRDKYGRTALQRIGNRSNEHLQMVLKYLPELSAPPLPKKENR